MEQNQLFTHQQLQLAKMKNVEPSYAQLIGQRVKLNGMVIKGKKKMYRGRVFHVVDVRRAKDVTVKEKGKEPQTFPGIELLLRDGIHPPQWSNPFPMREEEKEQELS